ncbi:hypothetical protein L1987_23983 [Smallanthus sonchifolius]|uniref:Uncharacterized protein n=1 Tax=Smallanthus sonchifolius TaxID=185202 RepID=A0ACB9IIZ0_9ASTR|nr:hypothetical protein L1987_23983 [Smallanthus sonchifolius]
MYFESNSDSNKQSFFSSHLQLEKKTPVMQIPGLKMKYNGDGFEEQRTNPCDFGSVFRSKDERVLQQNQ